MADLAWWQSLVSGVAGGAFTLLGQGLKGRQDSQAKKTERTAQLKKEGADRRAQFELDALMKLQDAVPRMARLSMLFHLEDLRLAKTSGDAYGSQQIADAQLDEDFRLSRVDVKALTSIVLDDEVRKALSSAIDSLSGLPIGIKTVSAAEEEASEAFSLLVSAQDQLGMRIRSLVSEDPDL